MDALNLIIEQICNYEDRNNTFEVYIRVINCIDECIDLLDINLYTEEEQDIRRQAQKIWKYSYNSSLLHNLYVTIGKKQVKIESSSKRRYLLESLSFYLCSFEEWPDDERANAMEYFVFNLMKTGVAEEKIYFVICKHFREIIVI